MPSFTGSVGLAQARALTPTSIITTRVIDVKLK